MEDAGDVERQFRRAAPGAEEEVREVEWFRVFRKNEVRRNERREGIEKTAGVQHGECP